MLSLWGVLQYSTGSVILHYWTWVHRQEDTSISVGSMRKRQVCSSRPGTARKPSQVRSIQTRWWVWAIWSALFIRKIGMRILTLLKAGQSKKPIRPLTYESSYEAHFHWINYIPDSHSSRNGILFQIWHHPPPTLSACANSWKDVSKGANLENTIIGQCW